MTEQELPNTFKQPFETCSRITAMAAHSEKDDFIVMEKQFTKKDGFDWLEEGETVEVIVLRRRPRPQPVAYATNLQFVEVLA